MLGGMFGAIFDFGSNLLSTALGWIGSFFKMIFDGLFAFLKLLFKPVLILIAIVFYFIFKLSALVYTLLVALLSIGKLFYSLVKGLLLTITGFSFSPPANPDHGSWTPVFRNVFDGLSFFQMDTIAYILLFLVWIITAVAAIRILSGGGRGAE